MAGLVLVCAGAVAADRNFSQFPGFAEYFAENPPVGAADSRDQALARRHAPRFHLPAAHEGPIDFYRDYIAHGYLVTGDGVRIEGPTPADLNRHRGDAAAQFVHVPGGGVPRPVVYASVARTDLWTPRDAGGATGQFIVAVYHLVFRTSGLPAALPAAAEASSGCSRIWTTGISSTTTPPRSWCSTRASVPSALTLQQHNYLRTYLVGESVRPGGDGRFDIDVAIRSNELYPHVPARRVRRAVRFLTPESTAFMMGYGERPTMSADDITDPVRTVDYELAFLPGTDAFYVFEGYLGERRLLPGRDGPPGARYNTLPRLKPLPAQILGGYWREESEGDWQRYRRSREHSDDPAEFSRAQGPSSIAIWPACGEERPAARCSDGLRHR